MPLEISELQDARRIAALVVLHCGDKYTPIFERFDNELQQIDKRADRLKLALNSSNTNLHVQRRTNRRPSDQNLNKSS